MKPYEIQIASTDEEILASYTVMSHLRPEVPEAEYLSRVRTLQKETNYTLVALKSGGKVLCVAGFRSCRSLGWGKYLYVDDLVTDQANRSTGFGNALFAWLVARAKADDCDELRLDSAVYRSRAHRFYFLQRMDVACFHFRLAL